MEKQVLDSPFTKKEYLNLVKQFNDRQDEIFDDFAISGNTIVNIGNREFVDYRPTIDINSETWELINKLKTYLNENDKINTLKTLKKLVPEWTSSYQI